MKQLLIATALVACASLPVAAQNLAIVNGKPVPMSRVNALVQQVERSGRPVTNELRAQIREELIMREIFAQEAERRGLRASPAYRQQLELAAQTILIRELFADFEKKNPVTDAQVKAEYDKFAASNAAQEFRARHILLETQAQAQEVIANLQRGAKFEDLARQLSKDTGSGANGGDLDWASANTFVPEFSQAMIALAKGQTTAAPVQTQFGWHVIRVDDIRAAQLPTLEELRPQIVQQLQQDRLMDFQENLRSRARIQ